MLKRKIRITYAVEECDSIDLDADLSFSKYATIEEIEAEVVRLVEKDNWAEEPIDYIEFTVYTEVE